MDAPAAGGLGEVAHAELPAFMARYRFFFNPIRYTSMDLAVIEAMLTGLPIVALATTEMATVVRNDESGYCDTDPPKLVAHMQRLLNDPQLARKLGQGARRVSARALCHRAFRRRLATSACREHRHKATAPLLPPARAAAYR
jgi:glycosyltransferase involved in cell wall biosynthesis